MFKKLLQGIGFLLVLSLVVISFDKLSRTGPQKKGNVRVSADFALFGVADAISGPGIVDRVADGLISKTNLDSGPSFEGARNTSGIAPGGSIDGGASQTSSRQPPAAPGVSADRAETEEGASEEESSRERLRKIRMLEIERGERKMYGGGGGSNRMPSGTTASPAFRRRATRRAPSDAEIAAELSGFVNKLKRRATDDARANPSVGSNLDEVDEIRGSDDTPILSLDGVDNRLEQSPALRALQGLNKDGASSLRMSRRGGMTDGSRDKAGKGFDGNNKTMDSIPIEEVTGAFGKKQIKAYVEDDGGGSVRDLK